MSFDDRLHPIIYLDAIIVKVRTDAHVVNRPVYVALGIDLEGAKHVLGLWMGKGGEGAKYWLGVLTEIRNRGGGGVCIVCTDGLTGFADAIETVWPGVTVQTCVVHYADLRIMPMSPAVPLQGGDSGWEWSA